jgi:diketogulonate reductase-like aldo/keto reductase
LGSRVGPRKGFLALEHAFDRGINWFDVAPSYGDGEAELLLGRFLAGKRDQVGVCTKVGIRAGHVSLPLRMAKPILRTVVGLAPQLRRHIGRIGRPATRTPLTAGLIRNSVEDSLRRLGTDRVEVLALHEPALDDIRRDDVLGAIEAVVAGGKARTISIAGEINVGIAATHLSDHVGVLQFAYGPDAPNLDDVRRRLPPARAITLITHGIFGNNGALEALASRLKNNTLLSSAFSQENYCGSEEQMAARFLLHRGLVKNYSGITLMSMFRTSHIDFNLQIAESLSPEEHIGHLEAILGTY